MSQEVRSVRPYDGLSGIWDMVARTAYIQLRQLADPVGGYDFGDGVAVSRASDGNGRRDRVSCRWGMGHADVGVVGLGGGGMWGVMSAIYTPMLKWYGVNRLLGTIAAYIGPSVHADDRGLGAEIL